MKTLQEVKLTKWIKDKVKKGIDKVQVATIKPGYFYTMSYFSKLYDNNKLDFYDEQPLILVLGKGPKHILGLNFHYLPPKKRKLVLKKLNKLYKKQIDEDKPFKNVKWDNVKIELKWSTYMVKLYIKDRIGKISRIKNDELENIVPLRSEDFIGISATKLWKQQGLL